MPIPLDDLPNFRLRPFLPKDYTEITEDQRKILDEYRYAYGCEFDRLTTGERQILKPMRVAHLRAAGLPPDYDEITREGQLQGRYASLKSWFKPGDWQNLCSDSKAFCKALYLFVEHYLKADPNTGGQYTMRDSKLKYKMAKSIMDPPMLGTEIAKTGIIMPRGTGKTFTIRQMIEVILLTKPFTGVLFSEIDMKRAKEELQLIAADIELCEMIHRDFGGRGALWPRTSTGVRRWCAERLDFAHLPYASVIATSLKSAQRGRHTKWIVWDDMENDNTVMDMEYRRDLFRQLFHVWLGMLYAGGKFTWIGNGIDGSCLLMALADLAFKDVPEEMRLSDWTDQRFDDWRRVHYGMIVKGDDGERESIQPDHTTVEAYDQRRQAWGAHAVAAEYDGMPIPFGAQAFPRNPYAHGYMHCQPLSTGGEEYFLDLKTKRRMAWKEFLRCLYKGTGVDINDSTSRDSDYGAVITVGVDADFVVYVLDAMVKHDITDEWAEHGYAAAVEWESDKVGYESDVMQKVVYRNAQRIEREFMDKGVEHIPRPIKILSSGLKKERRIIATIRPLYRKHLIRFPRLTPIEIDGVVHTPVENPSAKYFFELYRELDLYTDEGCRGHDDAVDALHIAIRTCGSRRGETPIQGDPVKASLEKWRKRGLQWPEHMLPVSVQEEHLREQEKDRIPAVHGSKTLPGYYEMDPYD